MEGCRIQWARELSSSLASDAHVIGPGASGSRCFRRTLAPDQELELRRLGDVLHRQQLLDPGLAIDIDEGRLQLAHELGATHTVNSKQADATAAVLDLTQGHGAELAVEVVGNTAALSTALHSVARGGRVGLVGNISPHVQLPLQIVVARELTLLGSCASAGEYSRAIELVAGGAIRVEPLISALAPLAEGPRWFERLYAREPGLMKVILQPT